MEYSLDTDGCTGEAEISLVSTEARQDPSSWHILGQEECEDKDSSG